MYIFKEGGIHIHKAFHRTKVCLIEGHSRSEGYINLAVEHIIILFFLLVAYFEGGFCSQWVFPLYLTFVQLLCIYTFTWVPNMGSYWWDSSLCTPQLCPGGCVGVHAQQHTQWNSFFHFPTFSGGLLFITCLFIALPRPIITTIPSLTSLPSLTILDHVYFWHFLFLTGDQTLTICFWYCIFIIGLFLSCRWLYVIPWEDTMGFQNHGLINHH